MFRDTFETRFTYLNGFMRNVSRFKTRPAMTDPLSGRRWTYEELNIEANRLAHALRASGVGKNDVVMFTLLNSPESVSYTHLDVYKRQQRHTAGLQAVARLAERFSGTPVPRGYDRPFFLK